LTSAGLAGLVRRAILRAAADGTLPAAVGPSSSGNATRAGWLHSPAAFVLALFLSVRIGLTVWMWAVRVLYPDPLPPDVALRPYLGVTPETNPWLEPWQRWDTLHYQAIAERGYGAFDIALFVPPLLPLAMHVLAPLLGGNTLLAGLFIANAAYVGALFAFLGLAQEETGDRGAARRATMYLAFFPTAFFFLAAYTESLFLLAAVLAVWATRRRRWIWAGVWGGVACLTRLPALLIVIPLIYAAWDSWRRERRAVPWLAPSIAFVMGMIFPLYVWLGLGREPWAPFMVQAARFGGGFVFPGANLLASLRLILSGGAFLTDVFDLLLLLVFLGLALPVWRRLPRVYSVFYLSFLLLYLTRQGGSEPLVGMVRYVLALFPAFLILGEAGKRAWVNRLLIYGGWAGLLFMSGGFAVWLWMG
jgi:hypothetical protein